MRFCRSASFFVLVVFLFTNTSSGFNFSTPFIAPGISASYSNRSAFRLYSNVREEEFMEKASLFTVGICFGKRFPIFSRFRLQITGNYEYGYCAEDTAQNVLLSDNSRHDLVRYSVFSTKSLIPEIHLHIPQKNRSALFLLAGIGIHHTSLEEQQYDIERTIKIEDRHLVSSKRFSLGYTMGVGLDFPVRNRFGGALVYGVRIWDPVKYVETRDLFPMGADYRERLITQYIQFNLLYQDPSRYN